MTTAQNLQSKLEHLPEQPGVYLMKNAKGDILYVGKAAVLAHRVRSYFQKGGDQTPKTGWMLSQVTDIETLVTRSELEALILESNLIKRHKPKFNVILRDDKQYPYLRLPIRENFPRLTVVRKVQKDGALYYGPYTPAGALKDTLKACLSRIPKDASISQRMIAETSCHRDETDRKVIQVVPETEYASQ